MRASKSRDADATRELLRHSARQRFARDGYAATTVREIAADAGVNVALINRYFVSKEGLFEECLTLAADQLARGEQDSLTRDQLVRNLVKRVAESPNGEQQMLMLLLLRSSGDEQADQIRRATLESFSRRIATRAGLHPDENEDHALRAQIVLATIVGMVLLRSSGGSEPLASASEEQLTGPLGDALELLLSNSLRVRPEL
jgi:AcrR family transcriptional regulator